MSQPQENNIEEEVIDLHKIWDSIKHSKWLLICVVIVCTCFAGLVSFSLKPSYQSSVLLKTNQQEAGINMATSLTNMLGSLPLMGKGGTPGAIETALITSRFILAPVIKKLNMDVVAKPKYVPVLGHLFANHYDGVGLAKPLFGLSHYAWGGEQILVASMQVAPNLLDQPLSLIALGKGKYLVKNKMDQVLLRGTVGQLSIGAGRSPQIKLNIAKLTARPGTYFFLEKNTIEKTITKVLAGLVVQEQGKDTGILQAQYVSKPAQLVINFLNALADQAYHSGGQAQAEKAAQTLGFLDKQLPMVKKSLMQAEARLSDYQSKTGNLDMTVQYKLIMQQILTSEQQLEKLRLERTQLLQKYTPTHPFVLTLDEKIKEVQKQIAQYEQNMKQLPVTDKKSAELMRDLKAKNQLYLMMLSRQQELKVLKAGVTSNIRILSYAAQPPLPIPVKHGLILFAGFVFGLVLSLIYVFLKIFLKNTISDAFYIEDVFGVPVQAILPFSRNQAKLKKLQVKREGVGKPVVLAKRFPDDVAIESLRSLRTTLQLSLLEAKNNIVTIAGLTPGVGKSFVATNLAYVLAFSGKKVLLIDADLRRGHIHEDLRVSQKPGLTDFLNGKATREEVVQSVDDNLDFIARGSRVSGTSEMLGGHKVEEYLNELSQEYDLILLDTAPILLITDGVLLAKHAGINLLVFSAGVHTHNDIKTGLNLCARNNITINGSILNFQQRKGSYMYSDNYHNRYGYYYQQADDSN